MPKVTRLKAHAQILHSRVCTFSIRKRVRRAKKEERRKEKRQEEYEQRLVATVNPGMGNKYEKDKLLKELRGDKRVVTGEQETTNSKGLTNSTTFFRNLQEVMTKLNTVLEMCDRLEHI